MLLCFLTKMSTDTLAACHIFTHSHCTVQTTCVHGSRDLTSSSPNCVPKTFNHPRVMFHLARHSTLNTSTSSLSRTSLVLHSSTSPTPDLLSTHPFTRCKDSRQDGISAEYKPLTGYEHRSSSTGLCSTYQIRKMTIGMILREWCRTIVPQPIIDTSSLRFGREHCDAARLGLRRRTIT